MKYLDLLGPCIDKYGLITQTQIDNFDGGDTLQREGMFAIAIYRLYKSGKINEADLLEYRKRYLYIITSLSVSCGNYKRHLDPDMWYSLSDRMSRDQIIPNVIAFGLMNIKEHKLCNFLGHCKRALLFTTNTRNNYAYPKTSPKYNANNPYTWKLPDLTLFSFWSLYIRSFSCYPLYPLLFIFDLDLLISSLIWRYRFKHTASNTDILNHTNTLIQAHERFPTPISYLARKILNVNVILSKLTGYFQHSGPRIDLLFSEFLKEIW